MDLEPHWKIDGSAANDQRNQFEVSEELQQNLRNAGSATLKFIHSALKDLYLYFLT